MWARVGLGFGNASSGRVGFDNASCGSSRASTFASFCSFSKLFSSNLWLFGVDLLPSKINSVFIEISCHFFHKICGKICFFGENLGLRTKVQATGWCEPQKTDASLQAFGFGQGSMPSLVSS